jgi:hypothetical protein
MAKTVGWWRRMTSGRRKLPDFLIIGAQRSGTSTLYQYIARHPHVQGAFRKEVHYFDTYYNRGPDWYRANFPIRGLTGEATPSYLLHPEVPARVAAMLPNVRLLAILRNPVDRAYSAFHRNIRLGRETRAFVDAIRADAGTLEFAYRERGIYVEHLEVWLKHFKRDQLLVVGTEEFCGDPWHGLEQVCRFLELPPFPDRQSVDEQMRRWFERRYRYDRYPAMDAAVREKLVEYYRPHNRRLHDLLDKDFGWPC